MSRKALIIIMLMASCGVVRAEPVTISNPVASVTVDPELGRITDWRLTGGENVLWVNRGNLDSAFVQGWKNYGGDKVWLVPQPLRDAVFGNGAPDPDLDGGVWRIIGRGPLTLTMRSGLSRKLHCVVTRTLRLDPAAARLTIVNRVERVQASPFPVHLWAVSQTAVPDRVFFGLNGTWYPAEPRYRKLVAEEVPPVLRDGGILEVLPLAGDWNKVVCWGDWLAAAIGGVVFLQSVDAAPAGCYPEGSNLQFYVNREYAELETLGDLRPLPPGEEYSNTVVWQLIERIPGREPEQLRALTANP